MYRRFEAALRPLTEAADASPAHRGPALTAETLDDALQALRDLAGAYNYDSVAMVMAELNKYDPTEKYAALCKRLGDAVDRVDWDAIRACVDPEHTEEARS